MPKLARRASIAGGAASRAPEPASRSPRLIDAIDRRERDGPYRPVAGSGPSRALLPLVTGLVHHLHGLIDGQQAARKTGVEHLRECVLAFAGHHVARLADEVLLALLPLHQLGEIRR